MRHSGADPSDVRRVRALALGSLTTLALVGGLYFLVPTAFAPRVTIRWVDDVEDAERKQLQNQLKLAAAERIDGSTWSYDLTEPSRPAIEAIVTSPRVADTHYIDRARRELDAAAPSGTTRIRGGLSLGRESPLVPWAARLSSSFLLLSAIWLATAGRRPAAQMPSE